MIEGGDVMAEWVRLIDASDVLCQGETLAES